jgi:FkbM family methyltransferase
MLSRLCECVEAFEPNPVCARTLTACGARNITSHTVGLSSREGEFALYVPLSGKKLITSYGSFVEPTGGVDYHALTVPVRRLDDYAFTEVDFIKIDVEGHELAVIRGATETIEREHPVLMIEIEQRHLRECAIGDVFQEILALGYSGSFFLKGRHHDITDFSVESHQLAHVSKPESQSYINNFFFFPNVSGLKC